MTPVKRKQRKTPKLLSEKDLLKIEIAKELGIWEQVQAEGWGALTNEVCGRIGGLVHKRLKEQRKTLSP